MKPSVLGLDIDREVKKMSGEAKKILKKLICAGIVGLAVLAGAAREARAIPIDANALEDGLEYYIRIDNDAYDSGELIEMLCRVTNVGDQSLDVSDLGIYTLSFELIRPEGDTVFSPYFGPPFPPMPPGLPDIVTLNPGQYMERRYDITSRRWGTDGEWVEEPFTTVGQYSISSKYGNPWFELGGPVSLEPDSLDFVIIPEPASIALLGLGLASLLVRKKGKAKCMRLV